MYVNDGALLVGIHTVAVPGHRFTQVGYVTMSPASQLVYDMNQRRLTYMSFAQQLRLYLASLHCTARVQSLLLGAIGYTLADVRAGLLGAILSKYLVTHHSQLTTYRLARRTECV
jgi:hypothetical protein